MVYELLEEHGEHEEELHVQFRRTNDTSIHVRPTWAYLLRVLPERVDARLNVVRGLVNLKTKNALEVSLDHHLEIRKA